MVNYLGEKFDAAAAMSIELTEDGILFNLTIDNATPYPIGEVFFPMIGGMQGIGNSRLQLKTTELVRPAGAENAAVADIFRVFTNMSWLGDQGPEQFYSYPKDGETWVEFFSPKLNRVGLFRRSRQVARPVVLRLELIPSNSGVVREDGNWPRRSELKGLPVGVSTSFVDFASAPAHKIYEAPPVLISFHDGDWREGRKIFQKWKMEGR